MKRLLGLSTARNFKHGLHARRHLSELDEWLTENVCGAGGLLEAHELVERATSAPLGTGSFERHLRRRYLGQG
jgi:Zn-dependent M32 family carboxypeptidase